MAPQIPATLKKCDIVMKGGITSGIVYPGLVCKLAESYQFESIGGTSAGAIAAAITAAAEYSRRHGRDVFHQVAEIPTWLGSSSEFGQGSTLFNLFQPQREMEQLFQFTTSFLVKGWLQRLWIWARMLWVEVLFGLALAALLIVAAVPATTLTRRVVIWAFAAFVCAGGVLVLAALRLLRCLASIPTHHFGLCTGYEQPASKKPLTLVAWLSERLDTLAGKMVSEPLTFGDLSRSGITLRMITTCITFGRPFTLPFETREFYFDPAEMRKFFPDSVVRWMENHPPISSDGNPVRRDDVEFGSLRPLPIPDDLPVIVATRLSLSFPILFCAVPFYAVDWTRRQKSAVEPKSSTRVPGDALEYGEKRKPERVWFSDGGICSNFPLHLFDSPIPRWPTFGVNLREVRPDREERIWMPRTNRGGIAHLWNRMETTAQLEGLGKLISSIFDSARNWLDSLQTSVPGYRDRVVHIYLDGNKEGGLNLNMADDDVIALSGYGEKAAGKLMDHFLHGIDDGQPTPMTWNNHRWIRHRSTLGQLSEFARKFENSLTHPEPGDPTYVDLIDSGPGSYPLRNAEARQCARELTGTMLNLGEKEPCLEGLKTDIPRPQAALRVRPSF
jgi:predicted acylesterase/phospholipase RssA